MNIGDKFFAKKKTVFLVAGDIVKVTDVDEETGLISFVFGQDSKNGVMSIQKFEETFEKIENAPVAPITVTESDVYDILENSDIAVYTVFDKCTVVSCKLPNGFIITESSACVHPNNYDVENCMDRIIDKIWELEGYYLQCKLHENSLIDDCICSNCECTACCEEECEEDEEEDNDCCYATNNDYKYTLMTCDCCDDYECPYNDSNENYDDKNGNQLN